MESHKTHNAPAIVFQLFFVTLLLNGCAEKSDKATRSDSTQVEQKVYEPEEQATAIQPSHADSMAVNRHIQGLTEIEKFAILDDYYLLSGLLKFKGDSVLHNKVISMLPKNGDFHEKYEIRLLDIKNGYIKYREPEIDTDYTKTYWNLEDGDKLIATESWTCSMACSSGLFFQKYKDGAFQRAEREVMIPGVEQLAEKLAPGYEQNEDPAEFRFVLPQKGKNIMFCLDKKCIELKWNGDLFEISDEIKTIVN